MRKMVEVKLLSGKVVNVQDNEVEALSRAGLLDKPVKEKKTAGETKEKKDAGETKDLTPEKQAEANERLYPSKKRPANFSKASINK